jgi:hypothetical protein
MSKKVLTVLLLSIISASIFAVSTKSVNRVVSQASRVFFKQQGVERVTRMRTKSKHVIEVLVDQTSYERGRLPKKYRGFPVVVKNIDNVKEEEVEQDSYGLKCRYKVCLKSHPYGTSFVGTSVLCQSECDKVARMSFCNGLWEEVIYTPVDMWSAGGCACCGLSK